MRYKQSLVGKKPTNDCLKCLVSMICTSRYHGWCADLLFVAEVFADFVRAVSDDEESDDRHYRGGYPRHQYPSEGAASTAYGHTCREEYAEPEG